MERSDIQKHVLEYATSCTTPFTAASAFDNIDAIETAKQVSDALGRLYSQRILARRKIDKVRYEYIRSEIRLVGFEMAPDQPPDEHKAPEPEKPSMKNNIGSAESEIIGLHRIAKLTTSCPPLKEAEQKQDTKPESKPDWLKTAHDIIHGDREKTYGDPGKNLRLIAQYWSTHTGITLTETDVCIMMQLLKIARLRNDPEHVDSWIDIIGYAALKNRIKNECKPKANS
jgi:hypothetical protein